MTLGSEVEFIEMLGIQGGKSEEENRNIQETSLIFNRPLPLEKAFVPRGRGLCDQLFNVCNALKVK